MLPRLPGSRSFARTPIPITDAAYLSSHRLRPTPHPNCESLDRTRRRDACSQRRSIDRSTTSRAIRPLSDSRCHPLRSVKSQSLPPNPKRARSCRGRLSLTSRTKAGDCKVLRRDADWPGEPILIGRESLPFPPSSLQPPAFSHTSSDFNSNQEVLLARGDERLPYSFNSTTSCPLDRTPTMRRPSMITW
jgi:hypothetical protein